MRHRQDKDVALREVVELLYEAATEPEEWSTTLDRVYDLFDSAAVHFFLWNNRLERATSSLSSTTYLGKKESLDYYLRIDPRRAILVHKPIGYTLLCHEHIDDAFVSRNEFFQDYSLRFERRYIMATNLLQMGPSTSVLALMRSPRQSPFGPAEQALLEKLRPHFIRTARMQQKFERLLEDAALGSDLLDGMQSCLIAADADARIVRMNLAAEAAIRRDDCLQSIAGRLAARTPSQTQALHRLIHQAIIGGPAAISGGSMIVDGPSGSRHGITVMPLSRRSTLLGKPPTPLALVTMANLAQPMNPDRQLAQMFGLTPAEAQLAAAVAGGTRLDALAEERRVRMSTLRTQMRAMYSKTGTGRQAELAHLVSNVALLRGAK